MTLPLESTKTTEFCVSRYLERIGCATPMAPTIDVLRTLQWAHLHAVPYENLDILMKKPLDLHPDAVFRKVVAQNRGGYCFESNALFRELLLRLGFTLTSCFARFWRDEGNPPPKPRHHILLVEVDEKRWLVDVGVGGIVPRWPVSLEEGLEQEQGCESYRMMRCGPFGWMLEEKVRNEWRPIFSFHDHPQLQRDFLTTSFWCEYAEDSIFRQQPMVMLRTTGGRHTYDGQYFKVSNVGKLETIRPTDRNALADSLDHLFGIRITDEQGLDALWGFQKT